MYVYIIPLYDENIAYKLSEERIFNGEWSLESGE